MRLEYRIFQLSALFLAVMAMIYLLVSGERVGTVMLLLSATAWVLLWLYLAVQAKRVGLRPSDRDDATMAEAAGPIGYFPGSSLWPFVLGLGTVLAANGLVFGPWLVLAGALVLFTGIVGLAIEAQSRG